LRIERVLVAGSGEVDGQAEGWWEVTTSDQVAIREASGHDRDAVWEIFHAVVAQGDTYAFDPETPRDEALAYWFQHGTRTYIAESGGRVVGTYILRPNRPGLGSHVSNAAFMVSPAARGLGVGRAMGEHCLDEARHLGYRAMQFNFVVSTNEAAVKLWQRLGFTIVGTLPGAFRHRTRGFVDAYVMFRTLLERDEPDPAHEPVPGAAAQMAAQRTAKGE
jgi:L-amino acid N-acyltransferase YncA